MRGNGWWEDRPKTNKATRRSWWQLRQRWEGKATNHTHSVSYVPRDAVMMGDAVRRIPKQAGFLFTPKFRTTFLLRSLDLWMKLSSLSFQTLWAPLAESFFSRGLDCFFAIPNSNEKIGSRFVAGLLWHRSAAGFAWTDGTGGGRDRGELSPSSSSRWPTSIVPAGSLRALSPNHSGFLGGSEVTCGLLWTAERRSGLGRGGFYGLSVRACVPTPTICSPPTHTAVSPAMCLNLARRKYAANWLVLSSLIVSVEACAACLFFFNLCVHLPNNTGSVCNKRTKRQSIWVN